METSGQAMTCSHRYLLTGGGELDVAGRLTHTTAAATAGWELLGLRNELLASLPPFTLLTDGQGAPLFSMHRIWISWFLRRHTLFIAVTATATATAVAVALASLLGSSSSGAWASKCLVNAGRRVCRHNVCLIITLASPNTPRGCLYRQPWHNVTHAPFGTLCAVGSS